MFIFILRVLKNLRTLNKKYVLNKVEEVYNGLVNPIKIVEMVTTLIQKLEKVPSINIIRANG